MLTSQKKDVESQLKNVKESDPFMQEYKDEGSRNLDESAEEAVDTREHTTSVAIEDNLTEESEDIDVALEKIEEGEYGICEVCKKPISEDRLKINPTAKRCIDCEKKAEA